MHSVGGAQGEALFVCFYTDLLVSRLAAQPFRLHPLGHSPGV